MAAINCSSTPSSLKRRFVSPDHSDSENVDPSFFKSLSKRKRADFDGDVAASKPPRYSLDVLPATKPPTTSSSLTPRLDIHRASTPLSAPAAAGRSPTKSKRHGLLGRKRFAPPFFGAKSPAISIAAALSGTAAHKKSKTVRTIEESKPKSWFFDIYEETEDQQDYRINEWTMTQSATILDISDDESKAKDRDDRGKENIPPTYVPEDPAASPLPAPKPPISRKDIMPDEPRTPLGDLNPADYYAEGLDASSVVLVHDDAPEDDQGALVAGAVAAAPTETVSEVKSTTTATTQDKKDHAVNLTSLLSASASSVDDEDLVAKVDPAVDAADIEIWESESAKDEDEKAGEIALAI